MRPNAGSAEPSARHHDPAVSSRARGPGDRVEVERQLRARVAVQQRRLSLRGGPLVNEHDLEALIAGAAAYEELLVPALFQEWTARLIDRAEIQPSHRVLDIACGTGVLARAAAVRVTHSGSVVGLDPAPGMLAVAKRLAPEIEWQPGTAESLPFPAESFDVAVSQFGLMFFTDRRQAIREMLRVVTRGGRIGVVVWDSLENIPAYAAEVALVHRIA